MSTLDTSIESAKSIPGNTENTNQYKGVYADLIKSGKTREEALQIIQEKSDTQIEKKDFKEDVKQELQIIINRYQHDITILGKSELTLANFQQLLMDEMWGNDNYKKLDKQAVKKLENAVDAFVFDNKIDPILDFNIKISSEEELESFISEVDSYIKNKKYEEEYNSYQ